MLTQDVIYKEEVSHCAAGVRWLKHLHALACSMDPLAGTPTTAVDAAAAQQQGQQQQEGTAAEGAEQGTAQQAAGAQQGGEQLPAWAEEARRHATVELWFHALVRAHFRGPLKPPL